MLTNSKILGTANRGIKPTAATPTLFYTVPASTQSRGRINICNQDSLQDKIRIAITPSGDTLANTDYIFYDTVIKGNSIIGDIMFDLPAQSFITVYSLLGQCSFVATGIESTIANNTTAKILNDRGIKPTAATPTLFYTVPASTQSKGRIYICNQGASDTIRIGITPYGGSIADTDYLLYDFEIEGNGVIGDIMFDLPAQSFITVYSLLGQCSFVSTGLEIS